VNVGNNEKGDDMTWGEAFGRSVKVFLIYVGIIISGGILIALGFGIMGASFFDSSDSFGEPRQGSRRSWDS
jgi:hypothetical protein